MTGTGRAEVLDWGAELPVRARSSENEAPGVMEARRLREEAEGVEGGEFERSLDMIGSGNGVLACLRRGKNVYLQSQCAVSNVFFMRNPRDVSTKDDDKQISCWYPHRRKWLAYKWCELYS